MTQDFNLTSKQITLKAKEIRNQRIDCYSGSKHIKNGVNDIAHHFLRHIRNAIAHGDVTKIKNGIIELKDYNSSGKQNMFGRIYTNMLFDIINIIIQ